jgi:hypothetical protein
MGDAGEGLIDAQARIAEQMEEREQERKRLVEGRGKGINPELVRRAESLRLARIELDRQRSATENAARKQQLTHALEELDRQLSALKL